ncbi:hypothetical protein EIP91_008577 [Steccherinum ochraceum]|uniref:DUF6533 domain-containing protein n=1 Tax=Steccherinum ochraceum TaxID=92696 RepID=A0A4R0RG48_9APHY|nr:hypothetical protein EIP91_008577 [Steccherinum ochraceum]
MSDSSLHSFDPMDAYGYVALSLVVYDTLLTFSREVDGIWRRKWSVITMLFVLQRWVLIFDGVIQKLPTTRVWVRVRAYLITCSCSYKQLSRCKALTFLDNIITILGLLGTAAFATLRIWAIWDHAAGPTLAVALASSVVPAINLYSVTQATSFSVTDGDCENSAKYSRAVSVRTVDVWRECRRIKGLKVTVSTLLLRDGTMYFGALLIMNIATLAIAASQTSADGSAFVPMLSAVGANLLARFMLDLRGVNKQGSSELHNVSSVVFDTRTLSGNLGAALEIENSTWVSGPADDVANDRGQLYQEAAVPFHAGLGLDGARIPLESAASSVPFSLEAYCLAALCLLAYDTLLTLSREVECIWSRKFSVVWVVFVLQRWVLVLDGMLQNLPTTRPWAYACVFLCTSSLVLGCIFTILGLIGTAAFSTLRIWAIWGHALAPTLAVALTCAVVPAIAIFGASQLTTFSLMTPDGLKCFANVKYSLALAIRRSLLMIAIALRSLDYVARSVTIASDALVLVLTWVKTADVWRESKRTKALKVTVSTLLLRDGTMYFGTLLIMNTASFFLDVFQKKANGSAFIFVLNAVGANLLARFLLDLRSVSVHQGGSGSRDLQTMSSLNFAAGNMGAPLVVLEDSAWVSGAADDAAGGRGGVYEEVVPHRAGLGLDSVYVPLDGVDSYSTEREGLSINLTDFTNAGSRDDVEESPRKATSTDIV